MSTSGKEETPAGQKDWRSEPVDLGYGWIISRMFEEHFPSLIAGSDYCLLAYKTDPLLIQVYDFHHPACV
ncbi:MAG TPA: hypothetical protein VKE92_00235, partial [Anaerolineales bacterium]|nr:hypothetical protein [Anaerolineales bacterium]